MLWTCPLFYLILFCAEVSLDIILTPDSETLTVLVGEPAIFRCSIMGGDLKNYQVSWYKKNENNSLTLVYRLSNSSINNISSNFKGNIDVLKGQCILHIQRATIKDTGTYYCASDTHSATARLLVASEPLDQTEGAGPMRRSPVAKMCTTLRSDHLIISTVISDER
uniref:Ig-like domain-containing protein n=1 Tax=Suricata suricatta TaxID=37032 RepID=A0A673TH07_SURSU